MSTTAAAAGAMSRPTSPIVKTISHIAWLEMPSWQFRQVED